MPSEGQPDAPAFAWKNRATDRLEFRDWYSGAILEDYYGDFVSYDTSGRAVLIRTYVDRQTGERAFSAVRILR